MVKKPIKNCLKRFARNNRAFDAVYGGLIRRKRKARYSKYSDASVDDRLILFESYMGRRYADSPKAIYEYMLVYPEFDDYHFVWCLRGRARTESSMVKNDPRTEIVPWGSDDYYKAYAMAKYWFANTRIPEAIKRKDEQVYIQCWHGTPLKKLGADIPAKDKSAFETTRRVIHNDASRYSYLLSPSSFFTEKMTSALDLKAIGKENIIRETGYPRNDSIANHTADDVERVKTELGIAPDKKVILYAPTYRDDDRKDRYEYHGALDFDRLLDRIPEDIVILFRTHYFISQAFDFERYDGRIIDVSAYPEIDDLYIISDMLITDYSSVMFDYGILKRPQIYYMYDLEHYRDELRGLYFDPEELPGRIVKTQEDLEDAINTVDDWAYTEEQKDKWEKFRTRFTPLDDGHATERVVQAVFRLRSV